MAMMSLCKCNNCENVFIDTNPQVDSVVFQHHFQLKELVDHQCPECGTDAYLVDITNENKHILALSLYNMGYVSRRGFPVITLKNKGVKLDFPNFHSSGSITGMKSKYYGFYALLVRRGGYIYNVMSEPEIYFNNK
jgi:hypothetical protein